MNADVTLKNVQTTIVIPDVTVIKAIVVLINAGICIISILSTYKVIVSGSEPPSIHILKTFLTEKYEYLRLRNYIDFWHINCKINWALRLIFI